MTHRPAVTLIEVLISMFIMAIGMLALLVLFPLGAVSMGQALKDDRCASTAAMAENVALAMPTSTASFSGGIRNDPNVVTGFGASPTNPKTVYVDPYGAIQALPSVGGVIPRVSPSYIVASGSPSFAADRWFSLPDDITFLDSGVPDTSTSFIDRGRKYSYAYLLRQLSANLVQLYVVVYSGRPVNTLTAEPTYTAGGTAGTNSIVVTPTGANPWPPTIKNGSWVLDSTNGFFYRVTNFVVAGTSATVEVQQNLIAGPSQITVMDNVAEVFDKGTGWLP